MIGNSPYEYVLIRTSIAALRLVAPASIGYLVVSLWTRTFPVSSWVAALSAAEAFFYLAVYLPRTRRLQLPPTHPPPSLTKSQRQALFHKCASDIDIISQQHGESYPTGWFLPPNRSIHLDDMVDWILWALFSSDRTDIRFPEWEEELGEYVVMVEEILGRKLEHGSGDGVRSMRLTLDPVKTAHRPLMWYMTVAAVDSYTSLNLFTLGFKHYTTPRWFQTFPPRPLLSLFSRRAHVPSNTFLPYWYRPHKSTSKLPVLFIHGIGIGLYPYLAFFQDIIARDPDVGIILLELLPLSMHMTQDPIPPRSIVINAIDSILVSLNIPRVVLAAHSYGTFLSAYILRPPLPTSFPSTPNTSQSTSINTNPLAHKISHTLLIDPIPILLHLPSVAHNFLYRRPRTAAEWQLWYFASADADVARTLGRAFFWEEGVLWGEDLREIMAGEGGSMTGNEAAHGIDSEDGCPAPPWGTREGKRAPETVQAQTYDEAQPLISHAAPSKCVAARSRTQGRNLAVVLAGADQIVPAETVRWYLTGEREACPRWVGKGWGGVGNVISEVQAGVGLETTTGPGNASPRLPSANGYGSILGINVGLGGFNKTEGARGGQLEVLFYPGLDHATVFDTDERRRGVVDVLERFVRE